MERILDGTAIWLNKEIFNQNKTARTKVYQTSIRNAKLNPPTLTFSCLSNDWVYEFNLKQDTDTNYTGSFTASQRGEQETFTLNLQVFENRLGLMLEGEWDEGLDDKYRCVIQLYYLPT